MEEELTIKQKDSIRERIKSEGFPQFIVDALRIRQYTSMDKKLIISLDLDFHCNIALKDESNDYDPLNQFAYIGRRFARDLQVQIARLLPEGRIEDKVIMLMKEYDNLRRRALSNPALPMFDSEFRL